MNRRMKYTVSDKNSMLQWSLIFTILSNSAHTVLLDKKTILKPDPVGIEIDFFSMMQSSIDDDRNQPPTEFTIKQLEWWQSLGEETGESNQPHLRREYRELTGEEQQRYFQAINQSMFTYPDEEVPDVSEYMMFTAMHRIANAPGAHGGPAFLPWHREFLTRFERALQRHDSSVSIPYWDSSLDQTLLEPRDSVWWTSEHWGNVEGINVTSGPFAFWPVPEHCYVYGELLTREAHNGTTLLYSRDKIEWASQYDSYVDIACLLPNCTFENFHGHVHGFFGPDNTVGHMSQIICSPSDPIFYSHHAFVDLQWEEFRQNYQTTDLTTDYPAVEDGLRFDSHFANTTMSPFAPLLNIDGLSEHYTSDIYQYSPRPSAIVCSSDADCGSSMLWCDTRFGQCTGKVQPGGECGNAEGSYPDGACICFNDETAHCEYMTCQCSEVA